MRKGRKPDRDELNVWKNTMKGVEKLSGADRTEIEIENLPKKLRAPSKQRAEPEPILPFRVGEKAPPRTSPRAATANDRHQPADPNLIKTTMRRHGVDATIDLHGMTVAEAQPALTGFIIDSYDAGFRMLRIITGKGRAEKETHFARKGVLRQFLPTWLADPRIAFMIADRDVAHPRKGGEGVTLVRLRRRKLPSR